MDVDISNIETSVDPEHTLIHDSSDVMNLPSLEKEGKLNLIKQSISTSSGEISSILDPEETYLKLRSTSNTVQKKSSLPIGIIVGSVARSVTIAGGAGIALYILRERGFSNVHPVTDELTSEIGNTVKTKRRQKTSKNPDESYQQKQNIDRCQLYK